MMKKLGVRWKPGLPFLDEQKVSHAFSRPGEPISGASFIGSPDMALVLVLAQDPNIRIEKGELRALCVH